MFSQTSWHCSLGTVLHSVLGTVWHFCSGTVTHFSLWGICGNHVGNMFEHVRVRSLTLGPACTQSSPRRYRLVWGQHCTAAWEPFYTPAPRRTDTAVWAPGCTSPGSPPGTWSRALSRTLSSGLSCTTVWARYDTPSWAPVTTQLRTSVLYCTALYCTDRPALSVRDSLASLLRDVPTLLLGNNLALLPEDIML